ncbi:PLP-dependent aminotransferase family protein [Pseudomonas wadenswilerensis]|uniref:MocR-like pyridoxine biosynthesis transcription factor PdxR n=1 Tax=Pseudomonas wadenswilerensis TaxID=1785161 RepID=UPI00215DE9A8|nr:PLP-dependent aminotransferase family protein [Pseudomonas wadenswilerensis]UVM24421.1 PLP-dependent aminotransferase family protein [Pseudomonas wadenswilerensis]
MPNTYPPLDPQAATPIYRQLYLRFRDAISAGRLQPGERLPSVRALAAELNLARGTVEAAYQMLGGEGYVQARGPAGTVVAPLLSTTPVAVGVQRLERPPTAPSPSTLVPMPLQIGLPALDAFPRKLWTRLVGRALRQGGLDGLVYPDPQGHLALRKALAIYLGVSRGISCTAEQIFICAGYRACLDLICRSLLHDGDRCWFEDPGYFQARRFLEQARAQLVPVPVDGDGLDVEAGMALAPDARFALVTPHHQSPLGATLSLPRRQRLLEWASSQGSWVIEDDYDSEYRYRGRPVPALKSLDTQGRVLYCATFSKVLAPGLRLAYLVVPQAQVARFATVVGDMQNHCPHLLQATVSAFIEEGHFARHLRKMRGLYADRRRYLVDALQAELGEHLQLDNKAAGMHLVAHLSGGGDDCTIAMRARDLGLAIEPLSGWYRGPGQRHALLLGFTNVASREQAVALARQLRLAMDL